MDEWLTKFEEARKAREAAERTIPLAGETLRFRATVAPEVIFRFRDSQRIKLEDLKASYEWGEKMQAAQNMNGEGEEEIARLIEQMPIQRQADSDLLNVADATILALLEPGSHEAWARLRSEENPHPLTYDECFDFLDYLLGRVADLPTVAPTDSSPGRTQTASKSKAESSSPAKTQARSG